MVLVVQLEKTAFVGVYRNLFWSFGKETNVICSHVYPDPCKSGIKSVIF
jgi:hypothetical protein